jgi:ribosomal-protein-alanine N-acetyltransferase
LIFAPTTAAEFDEYLARFDGGDAVGFVIRINATKELAGFVNISRIVRAPDRRGALGYGGFAATAGHGYVAEAVRLAVRYAFGGLGLDQLDADIQPANTASRRVIEQIGFQPVAAAPRPICIDGKWHDHERWMITAKACWSKALKYLDRCTCHAKR